MLASPVRFQILVIQAVQPPPRHTQRRRRLRRGALPGAEQFQHVTNQRRGRTLNQLRMPDFSLGDDNSLGALPPSPRSLSQGTWIDEPGPPQKTTRRRGLGDNSGALGGPRLNPWIESRSGCASAEPYPAIGRHEPVPEWQLVNPLPAKVRFC